MIELVTRRSREISTFGVRRAAEVYEKDAKRRYRRGSSNWTEGFQSITDETIRRKTSRGLTNHPRWSAHETDQLRQAIAVKKVGISYEVGYVTNAPHHGSSFGRKKSKGWTVFDIVAELTGRGWVLIAPPTGALRKKMIQAARKGR